MDSNNNNFKYQHSQLLQIVYEAHKDGLIDNLEKSKIKELMMTKDPSFIQFCNKYGDDDPKKINSGY